MRVRATGPAAFAIVRHIAICSAGLRTRLVPDWCFTGIWCTGVKCLHASEVLACLSCRVSGRHATGCASHISLVGQPVLAVDWWWIVAFNAQ